MMSTNQEWSPDHVQKDHSRCLEKSNVHTGSDKQCVLVYHNEGEIFVIHKYNHFDHKSKVWSYIA